LVARLPSHRLSPTESPALDRFHDKPDRATGCSKPEREMIAKGMKPAEMAVAIKRGLLSFSGHAFR
jgi:hypothetical protein